MKIIELLKGKKTYIIAAIVALQALYAYTNGDLNAAEAINQFLMGAGLGTLRAGVQK